MEDSPAFNTRKGSISKGSQECKLKKTNSEEISAKEDSSNISNNAITPAKTNSPQGRSLDKQSAERIKKKAKRISGSKKISENPNNSTLLTPVKKKKKAVTKDNTPAKPNSPDIRKFLNFKEVKLQDMSAISEVLTEAHTTLEQTADQGGLPNDIQSLDSVEPNVFQAVDEDISVKKYIVPLNSQALSSENNNSMEKNSTPQVQGGSQPQPQHGQPQHVQVPNFNDMSNQQLFEMIVHTMTQHKEEIQADIRKVNQEVGTLQNSVKTNTESITHLQESITINDTKHVKSDERVTALEDQVKVLAKTVVRQNAVIDELVSKEEQSNLRAMRNNLIIKGITETKGEIIKAFFRDKMLITHDIQIQYAYRVGSGETRPMIVHLKNNSDKGKIFKHSKNLKDLKNEKGRKFQVRNQLTAKATQKENRNRDIVWQNHKKRSTLEDLEISFKKGELHIGHTPYKKLIHPPTSKDILLAEKQDKIRWKKVKTVKGNVITQNKCCFQGVSVITNKIETIRDAYKKLREEFGEARHIVLAFRLPGRNFPSLQDYVDDDEDGAGATLLKLLSEAQIYNRAVFVIRHYGGEHLGPARFRAYTEAAQSAITYDPYNGFSKCNQTPWPKEMSDPPPPLPPQEEEPTQSAVPAQLACMEEGNRQNESSQHQLATRLFGNPSNRGRQLSGPTRPLADFYNRQNSTEEAWSEYYQNKRFLNPNTDWNAAVMSEEQWRTNMQNCTTSITSLTQEL